MPRIADAAGAVVPAGAGIVDFDAFFAATRARQASPGRLSPMVWRQTDATAVARLPAGQDRPHERVSWPSSIAAWGQPSCSSTGSAVTNPRWPRSSPTRAGRWRRLTLDCRGQGGSAPDPQNRYAIQTFAEDVLRLADDRHVDQFAVGGISMGAAIALHLAVHHPERVTALILARPAWLFGAAPPNMVPFAEVAQLLGTPAALGTFDAERDSGKARARGACQSQLAARLLQPAKSRRPPPRLIGHIAIDGPGVTREQAAALDLPTLVIGHWPGLRASPRLCRDARPRPFRVRCWSRSRPRRRTLRAPRG